MNNFRIDFIGIRAIISRILVITAKNPVISVLYLITVFINITGYLVILGINFIGLSYLIIYIGAILILFLFVFNLQVTDINIVNNYTKNLPLGTIIGILFIYEIITFIHENNYNIVNQLGQIEYGFLNKLNIIFIQILTKNSEFTRCTAEIYSRYNNIIVDNQFNTFIQIRTLGNNIYTNNSLWLIIRSLILLLAIVGPITTRR